MKRRIILLILIFILIERACGFTNYSPYSYCAANPINFVDPNGCEIRGISKEDTQKLVNDFREIFSDEVFTSFANLIVQGGKKQNGKSLAPISSLDLEYAFSDVLLNEDQQALVDMVVNTINSKDIHKVSYIKDSGVLSSQNEDLFLSAFMNNEKWAPHIPQIIEANGGLPVWLIMTVNGNGSTVHIKNGSHSLIIGEGDPIVGRAVTAGHEILGHGRSWASGLREDYQHEQSIRTENLILRVMGTPIIKDGTGHGPKTIITNPSLLPSFR